MRYAGVAVVVCLLVTAGCVGGGGDGTPTEPGHNVTMVTADDGRAVIAVEPTARLDANATVVVSDGTRTVQGHLPEPVELGETLYVAVDRSGGNFSLAFGLQASPRSGAGWWDIARSDTLEISIDSDPVTIQENLSA